VDLRIDRVGYDHPDAVTLIAEIQQELVMRYGTPDEGPAEAAMFEPPRGAFFIAYDGGRAIASGAWRLRTDVDALGTVSTAEIKRMYVVPRARGRGFARTVLAHLEGTARAAGAEAMILETGLGQPEAIALYESEGYTPIPRFGHYRDEYDCRCFARRLDRL
jgi:GNAT superfamily N-acetyltransferase